MLFVLIIVSTLFVASQCDLQSERIANARLWIERAQSSDQTTQAYGPTVVNFTTIYHRVNYAGSFGPGILALEYDYIVNGLQPLIGFNPVKLGPKWDVSTTRWLTNNILRVDYNIAIGAGFNPATFSYVFDQEDFRFVEYIVFDANTPLINTGFTVQDQGADTLFTITTASIPAATICGGFIFPACSQINPVNNQSYINETGFTGVVDCITKLSIIDATPQPCPYPQRSNTLACRALHGLSSFFIPSVHCSHVKQLSMVCKAQCLPACANCHPNATCVAGFASDFPLNAASYAPLYRCECKNGFVGDGQSCVALVCPTGSNNRTTKLCPTAIAGSTECVDNLCKCKASFINQPTTPQDHCGCPSPSIVRYIDKEPICIPQGRCLTDEYRYICNSQEYNQVKCRAVNNTFNPFGVCVCNPGFTGGYEYPCQCAPEKRVVWSPSVDGSVCLAPNECTLDRDCTSPQVCHFTPANTFIGTCAL